MRRRTFLAASTAALAAPRLSLAQNQRVIKFIVQANLAVLDPIVTTAYVTRHHGLMIWDTLFGVDEKFQSHPQMLETYGVSADGLVWSFKLREGLKWHDGSAVRSADCVASIKRWSERDAMGQRLVEYSAPDGLRALDDRQFEWRLAKPFPMLPYALGKFATPIAFMMPERIARTEATKPLTIEQMIGSGPFQFKADEFVSGSRIVYTRFDGYVPRQEHASLMAGGKVVHVDRVEWNVISDSATSAAALVNGEMDWWEQPLADLLPSLQRDRNIVIDQNDPLGLISTIRFNCLQPPFNSAAIRRAILPAVVQEDYMMALMGNDESLWRNGVGVFAPNTPMASGAGMDVLTGPRSVDEAKRQLERSGYRGEKIVLMGSTDFPVLKPLGEVTYDLFQRIGLNVDYAATDWGTVVQRRNSKEPVDKGGWSAFCTSWNAVDMLNPAGHLNIRGNGERAWIGWPTAPRLEELRDAWFEAPDESAQKKICDDIQMQVWQDVPYIPLGQYFQPTGYRKNIRGVLRGGPIMFYNVRKE